MNRITRNICVTGWSLLVCISLVPTLTAQDRWPSPITAHRHEDSLFALTPSTFIRGWNFGMPVRHTSNAMHTNMKHHSFDNMLVTGDSSALTTEGHDFLNASPDAARNAGFVMNLIPSFRFPYTVTIPDIQPGAITDFRLSSDSYEAADVSIGFRYEPEIDATDTTDAFVPDPNATPGASFGFRTRSLLDDTVSRRRRMQAVDYIARTNVLRNIWPQDQLHSWFNGAPATSANDLENTKQMVLVVNLRRADGAPDDNAGNQNAEVLRIRLPYKINHDATSATAIRFARLPDPASAPVQLNTLDPSYGLFIPTAAATGTVRELIITRRMIPSASAGTRDINIVATFSCDSGATTNPYIKRGKGTFVGDDDVARITSMDIEVDYSPSIDVEVDFIGIRTQQSHQWLSGWYQEAIRIAHDTALYNLRKFDSITGHHYKIHRIYGRNEAEPQFWEGLRHYNLSEDSIAITEVAIEWPRRYKHHTAIERLWQGNTTKLGVLTFTPTVWQGNSAGSSDTYRWHGYANGYNSLAGLGGTNPWVWNHTPGTAGSWFRRDYEVMAHDVRVTGVGTSTDTLNCDLPMSEASIDAQIVTLEGAPCLGNSTPLSALEGALTFTRFHGRCLFDSTVWYANIWTDVKVKKQATSRHFTWGVDARPKTAEEIRMQIWSQLVIGAKGLITYYGPSEWRDSIVHTLTFDKDLQLGFTYSFPSTMYDVNGVMSTPLSTYTNASNELGYDFIPVSPVNDPDLGLSDLLLDNTLSQNPHYFANVQVVSDSRLYLGLLSTRMEAARVMTQIQAVEDSLIHLHLLGWKGVGFRRWVAGDSARMAGYMWLDTLHQFVRPVNRFDSQGYPAHEDVDSMFYDITLHSKDGFDADSIFYVGVLNRRTNPRVKAVGTITSTNPEDSTLFFSGEEWRELVRTGTYNRIAQLGSRMIRIPFHYTRKSGSAYNLRIKEVSWDTSVYSGPMIDTTIGGDVALEVAFQPGEGKFFRVEAFPASGFTPARGFLDHSNQRKIVAYPKAVRIDTVADAVDTSKKFIRIAVGDTIRYHSVYHRRPTLSTTDAFTETGPVAVYYRRSAPVHVSKDTLTGSQSYYEASMLEWEDEILLSDSLYYQVSDISLLRMGALSCAYPAIVVRTDTAASTHAMVSRVYVVYGCEYRITTSSPWQVLVSEAVIPADSSRSVQIAYHAANPPNVLASTMAPTTPLLENWGTPMINASNKGNFYCWSDATSGIGYGFKLPDQKTFAAGQRLYVKGRAGYVSSHPSLNSYSRLYLGEDDASMVWQEGKNSSSEGNFIFYTRIGHNATAPYAPYLFLNPGGTAHRQFVTSVPLDLTFNPNVAILTDTNVVLDEENVRAKHAFPVVYRHLSDWEAATTSPLYTLRPVNNVCDRVYWQTQKYYPTAGKWRITRRPIDVREWYGINGTPDSIWTMAPHYIFDQSNHLKGPDVAQGTQWGDGSSNPLNPVPWYADSTVVLNFWSESSPSSSTPELWHMQYGWNYYGQNVDHDRADLVTAGWMKRLYEYGRYPHLAARHSYTQSKEWMRNRRIFEDDIATRTDFQWSPGIMQSSQYFYRQAADATQPMAIRYGGFRGGDNAILIGPIMKHETGEMIPMTGEDIGPNDQDGHGAQHKLVSTWMEVPAVSDVSILSMNEGTELTANLYVERESTGELLEVEPSQTTQVGVVVPNALNGASEILTVSQYTMLGSENERYRFVLIADRADVYQVEDIQLIQPEEAEAFSKALPAKSQILDLRSMQKSANVALNDIVVSPSPARDQVRIVVNMRTDTEVRYVPVATSCIITDERGAQMHRVACNTVDALTVLVGTWPTGVYNVRVMSQLPNGSQTVTAKCFMVLR